MNQIWNKRKAHMLIISFVLILSSCIDGYHDDWTFSPGVTNAQLESPDVQNIKWTLSPEGNTTTVTWDVILGAGGYNFLVYNVDNPNNPVLLIDSIIDGCRVNFNVLEDTRYLVSVKTLGNTEYNNKEALQASTKPFDTYIVGTLIPKGTNLTEYFTTNPHVTNGVAYLLEAGGEYTITGDIAINKYDFVLAGLDKNNHPKITVTTGGKITTAGAGLKLKFVDFDLSGSTNEFISYASPNSSFPIQGTDSYSLLSHVVVSGCNFKGLTNSWVKSASATFVIPTFTINNCIFEMKLVAPMIALYGKAYVNSLKITNSTLYNKSGFGNDYNLILYGNGDLAKSGFTSANVTLLNNTLYNISYAKNIANYNMLRPKATTIIVTITLKENIFLDCGNREVVKRFATGQFSNGGPIRNCDKNSYWYAGAFPATEIGAANTADFSGTHFEVDPSLEDPANGNFTVKAAQLINARIGDPRWLPAQ